MNQANYANEETGTISLAIPELSDMLVAVWRISRRGMRDSNTPQSVLSACESAMDRINMLGFRLDEMVGHSYDENLRVCVIDQKDTSAHLIIKECLSPAVFFENILIRAAEVVIGGEKDGATDC